MQGVLAIVTQVGILAFVVARMTAMGLALTRSATAGPVRSGGRRPRRPPTYVPTQPRDEVG